MLALPKYCGSRRVFSQISLLTRLWTVTQNWSPLQNIFAQDGSGPLGLAELSITLANEPGHKSRRRESREGPGPADPG
jgi:hypothetical protein